MIVDILDTDFQLLVLHDVLELRLAAAAGGDNHDLAVEVFVFRDAGAFQDQKLARRHIGDRREIDLLVAGEGVDRAAAFDVDRPVRHKGLAGLDVHRHIIDLEVGKLQLLPGLLDDAQAHLDRIAGRLFVVVEIGCRQNGFAVAHGDRIAGAHLLDDAVELLRQRRRRNSKGEADRATHRHRGSSHYYLQI